ncbi:MAG: DUF2808 domain-containing protein [Cyanobacteria bacterium J06588_5]
MTYFCRLSNLLALGAMLTSGAIVSSLLVSSTAVAQEPTSRASNQTSADLAQSGPSPSISPADNPKISFRRPLRVTNIRVPIDRQFRQSEYFFTLDFPADAVEPLQKLTFEQIEGVSYPRYHPGDSYALGADRSPLPITATDNDDDRTVTVEFDPPVQPGQQITVALRARNPRDGIYLYRLTAFPVGATDGQYAGIERFNIYAPSRRDRFFYRSFSR